MSIFVTQSVDSSVTVLVFARPGPVADAAQSALHAKGLEVVLVDPFSFSAQHARQLSSQTFYKIVWMFDDTQKGTSVADELFQFLFSRSEPVLVLTPTLGREDPRVEWTSKKAGDDQLLDHLKKHLPRALIVITINWLDQPEIVISPLYFYLDADTASRELASGVVTQEVIEQLIKTLVRPHSTQVLKLERSRRFTAQEIAKFFPPQPEPSQTPPQETVVERIEQSVSYATRPEVSRKTLPPTEVLQLQLAEFEERYRHINVKVLPVLAPKISNRQRFYEENIPKIKQRFQKQRHLRPVCRSATTHQKSDPQQIAARELQPLEKNLEVTIQQLFGSQRQEQRQDRIQQKVIKTARAQRKQQRQKKVMRLLSVLGFLVVTSMGVVLSFVWMRTTLFNLVLSQANSESLADQEVWQSAQTKFLVNALASEVQAYQWVAGAESLPETTAVLSAVRQMQTIHNQRQELKQLTEKSVSQVLGKTSGDVFSTVTDLAAQQQTLYSSLSVIQTQLQALTTEFMDDRERQAVDAIMAEIQQARKQVATFEQVRQLMPAFLAQNERRRIGVILQDSQELRASGGVIQGVYLITLEKGQIIDQQFYDVKQLQGDQTATLAAPTDYQKYLSQNQLQLMDAGWGADFTETATMVNGLLDHSLGRKADFMVGVTTNTLHEIIVQTGPLAIDETKETLTDKNFFERLELHPEETYLQTVFKTLVDRLLTQPVQAQAALSVLAENLQNGQVYLVSAQTTENDVLNSLGWAGQVSTPQCPSLLGTDTCQISTIYQIDSNIGLNKLGALIERAIQHTVKIGKTYTKHQRIITFTNEATSSKWPTGAYKNYLRFYIPSGSQITNVKVGESVLDLKTLDRGETKSGQYIGFVVNVPVHSRQDVTLEYEQEYKYAPNSGFAFFDQKQAGTRPDEYKLVILPEDELQAAVIAPTAKLENNQIIFEQPREKHQFVGIKFR